MAIVTIVVKTLAAFSDSQVIIISTRSSYIKKIRPAFSGPDTLAVNAFHFLVVVVVRHNCNFYSLINVLVYAYKYNYLFLTAKFAGFFIQLLLPVVVAGTLRSINRVFPSAHHDCLLPSIDPHPTQ